MERQNYLSKLSEYEGMSLRAIAKQTGHHFNTVKKYVGREDWNEIYTPRKERETKLDPLKVTIDGWITEDLKRGRILSLRAGQPARRVLFGMKGAYHHVSVLSTI